MNAEQKAIILALASIVIGIAVLLNETYRIYLIVLYPIMIIIYFISSYINKIEEHDKKLKEMSETPHGKTVGHLEISQA